jgi:hypothetical protein
MVKDSFNQSRFAALTFGSTFFKSTTSFSLINELPPLIRSCIHSLAKGTPVEVFSPISVSILLIVSFRLQIQYHTLNMSKIWMTKIGFPFPLPKYCKLENPFHFFSKYILEEIHSNCSLLFNNFHEKGVNPSWINAPDWEIRY